MARDKKHDKKEDQIKQSGLSTIVTDGIKKIPNLLLRKDRSNEELNKRILHEMHRDNKDIPVYAIVGINNKYKNEFHAVGATLASNFGDQKYEQLSVANAVLFRVDQKESYDLISRLNKNKKGDFSRNISKTLKKTDMTYQSGLAYSPETYMNYLLAIQNLNSFFKKKSPKTRKRRSIKEVVSKSLWHHDVLGIYDAWRKTKGSSNYQVAVIDTGVDYKHSELMDRFGKHIGYNYVKDNNDPMDDAGHGTHVAGSIAGKNTGVAPLANLIALKVLNGNGVGSLADVMKAVDYCGTKSNIKVLNLSLGSSMQNPIERELYKAVANQGKLIFAAAGNSGKLVYEFPAAYPRVISTAATNQSNKKASFSTYNDQVTCACPGVNIYSTYPKGSYRYLNGTSMATPQNAGIAALAIALNPNLTYVEYCGILKDTCKHLGSGEKYEKEMYGFGLTKADQVAGVLRAAERLRKNLRN